MIDVHIKIEQTGEEMKETIAAKSDKSSTEKEMEVVDQIVAYLQRRIIEKGGSATFVERNYPIASDDVERA